MYPPGYLLLFSALVNYIKNDSTFTRIVFHLLKRVYIFISQGKIKYENGITMGCTSFARVRDEQGRFLSFELLKTFIDPIELSSV